MASGVRPSMRRTALALLSIGFACTPTPMRPTALRPSAAPVASPLPTGLSSSPLSSAPWLEPPLPLPAHDDPITAIGPPDLTPREILAVAPEAVLVQTDHGVFLVTEGSGIDGPYDLGTWSAVGFGGSTLFVVRPTGRVLRAPLLANGGLGAFALGGLVDGATQWAFGAPWMAAVVGDGVFVSRDEGLTFERRTVDDGPVRSVFVGLDGLLVVQARRSWVSRDGGKTFALPLATPPLHQHGAWIYGSDASCTSERWVALGGDGRFHRVPGPPPATTAEESRRRAIALAARFALDTLAKPRPAAAMPWPGRLPPPPGPLYEGYPLCAGKPPVGTGRKTKTVQTIVVGTEESPAPCAGLACARVLRAPIRSRTSAALLGDGLCADPKDCVAAAPWQLPPHLLFAQRGPFHVSSVATTAVPLGCRPGWVASSGGLVVLACRSTQHLTTLWTADATRELRLEASLALGEVGPDDLQMVEDGSALLAAYGVAPTDAHAWVRRPVAVGVEHAFREVTRPGGVAYLLQPAAQVDVVVAEADGSFSIVVDAPDGATRVVAGARLAGDLFCVGRKDGRHVGLRRTPTGGFRRLRFRADGVDDDGIALDGSGRLSPSCGL